jgi:hypothetical protein
MVENRNQGEEQVRTNAEVHPPLPNSAADDAIDELDLNDLAQILFNKHQVLFPPAPLQHADDQSDPLTLYLNLIYFVFLSRLRNYVHAHSF